MRCSSCHSVLRVIFGQPPSWAVGSDFIFPFFSLNFLIHCTSKWLIIFYRQSLSAGSSVFFLSLFFPLKPEGGGGGGGGKRSWWFFGGFFFVAAIFDRFLSYLLLHFGVHFLETFTGYWFSQYTLNFVIRIFKNCFAPESSSFIWFFSRA